MNQENIGLFIAESRKKKNLTQKELAKKIGVTNRSISNWETGKCMPEYELLIPLTKELDITISELINGQKEKTSNKDSNKTIEKIIHFLEVFEEKRNKKYKLIGNIIIIIGFLIILRIIIFEPSYHHQKNSYIILGSIIAIIGYSYTNQLEKITKMLFKSFKFFIFILIFLATADIINIKFNDMPTRYSSRGIGHPCGEQGGYITYERGLFFDTYTYHKHTLDQEVKRERTIVPKNIIISLEIDGYYEEYKLSKYCDKIKTKS